MTQLRFTTAGQLIEAYPNLRETITFQPMQAEPFDYIDRLLKSSQSEEALPFCAYLLPRRDSVRWLCQSLRAEGYDDPILKLAEDWVKSPTETQRVAALNAGMAAKDKNAAAWAAIAAGWSGGNLSSDERHPMPTPAHLTLQGVTVGMMLLLGLQKKEEKTRKLQEFVTLAVKLLKQGAA